jgi:hypothetical protein
MKSFSFLLLAIFVCAFTVSTYADACTGSDVSGKIVTGLGYSPMDGIGVSAIDRDTGLTVVSTSSAFNGTYSLTFPNCVTNLRITVKGSKGQMANGYFLGEAGLYQPNPPSPGDHNFWDTSLTSYSTGNILWFYYYAN